MIEHEKASVTRSLAMIHFENYTELIWKRRRATTIQWRYSTCSFLKRVTGTIRLFDVIRVLDPAILTSSSTRRGGGSARPDFVENQLFLDGFSRSEFRLAIAFVNTRHGPRRMKTPAVRRRKQLHIYTQLLDAFARARTYTLVQSVTWKSRLNVALLSFSVRRACVLRKYYYNNRVRVCVYIHADDEIFVAFISARCIRAMFRYVGLFLPPPRHPRLFLFDVTPLCKIRALEYRC